VAVAFVFISVAPASQGSDTTNKTDNQRQSPETIDQLNPAFRSMSRLGLVVGCLALGLFRTQLALFFTENLGFSKSQFGILTALCCFASFAGFNITGRTKNWHYKLSPFIGSQLIIAVAMLMILFSTSLIWLCTAAVFVGIGQSFVYASHQFYCVSGEVKRSGSMAIHEILISIGYASGSIAGGYLAEYLSRYWPYWFCFAAVIIALAVQVFIFASHKKRRTKTLRA
jgi:predicted MFS family arabinose efflux permease